MVYGWSSAHQRQPETKTHNPHSQECDLLPRRWHEHHDGNSVSDLRGANEEPDWRRERTKLGAVPVDRAFENL